MLLQSSTSPSQYPSALAPVHQCKQIEEVSYHPRGSTSPPCYSASQADLYTLHFLISFRLLNLWRSHQHYSTLSMHINSKSQEHSPLPTTPRDLPPCPSPHNKKRTQLFHALHHSTTTAQTRLLPLCAIFR
jgi:hypothetical protein